MSLDVSLYYKVEEDKKAYVFDANITHNLTEMADKIGIYECVWRPEEKGIIYAKELIKPLVDGLVEMRANKEYYGTFDSPNGYGTYDDFLIWIENYLEKCMEYPNAFVEVSR